MPKRTLRFTDAMNRSPIGEQVRRIEGALARLRQLANNLEHEVDAINANWGYSDDTKAYRIDVARRGAMSQVEETIAEARAAHARGLELVQAMHVRAKGSNVARERVRALLERDVPAGDILERAVELEDENVVTALRHELLWKGKTAEGDAVPEVAALIGACDEVIATISTGDARAESMAAVALRERAPALEALAEVAVLTAAGKEAALAGARMRLGYQENAAARRGLARSG